MPGGGGGAEEEDGGVRASSCKGDEGWLEDDDGAEAGVDGDLFEGCSGFSTLSSPPSSFSPSSGVAGGVSCGVFGFTQRGDLSDGLRTESADETENGRCRNTAR